MEVKVNVKVSVKAMYNFLIHHTYFSLLGVVGIFISVCAFGGVIFSWNTLPLQNTILLLASGLMFTVIQPLLLYFRAKKQVEMNGAYTNPFTYEFDDKGIHISQGENETDVNWSDVVKVTGTSQSILIYVGRTRAFIITKESLGDQVGTLKELINKNVSKKRINIK